MNYFKDTIKLEQKRIQRLIDLTPPLQPLHESGSCALNVARRRNTAYYYGLWRAPGAPVRKEYLGTAQSPRVRQLVTARYRDEMMRRLEHNSQLLQKLDDGFLDYDDEAILAALPATYRDAAAANRNAAATQNAARPHQGNAAAMRSNGRTIDSSSKTMGGSANAVDGNTLSFTSGIHCFDQRYEEICQWAADYERNSAPFPKAEIYAKDGTRMRSKGECIIYNIFDERRLPNRYDSVITIFDHDGHSRDLSPDFLIQCLDGSLIILEHLGWSSGLKYGYDFGEKCYWYLQSGFVLGKNFFVTSDDVNGGTDSRMVLKVVEQVERLFYGY